MKETENVPVERHPLKPFLPPNARLLMLGSFPPPRKRWCMEFFYPNRTNMMWEVFGEVFFGDHNRLVDTENKSFRKDDIERLLNERGISLFDTATAVRRLSGNASDKDLEIELVLFYLQCLILKDQKILMKKGQLEKNSCFFC